MNGALDVVSDDGSVMTITPTSEAIPAKPHTVIEHVAGNLYLHRQVLMTGFDIVIDGKPLKRYVDFYALGENPDDEAIVYIGTRSDSIPDFFECRDESDGSTVYNCLSLAVCMSVFRFDDEDEAKLTAHMKSHGHDCLAVMVNKDGFYTYGELKRLASLYELFGNLRHAQADDAKKAPKRRYTKSMKLVECQIDPLTKALSGRSHDNHLTAADYWPSLDDSPIDGVNFGPERSIKTSRDGHAIMRVAAGDGADITSSENTYQIGALDQYFLDAAATLVFGGSKGFSCAQLLKLCGYNNPYATDMAKTREQALNACMKAAGTRVFIDTTEARRGTQRGKYRVTNSITVTNLAKWEIDVMRLEGEDGEVIGDFDVRYSGSPEEVLPLAAISRDWEMITRISSSSEKFKGMRLTIQDRLAWRYILKQVNAGGLSNTIKLETMFRDIDLESIDAGQKSSAPREVNRRRARLVEKLAKMLDSKCKPGPGQLFKTWSYTKSRKTGEVDGFKITPLDEHTKLPAPNKKKASK